ncbi:MAG TPA: DUF3330 domain-containing protein [Burkholderiales bacterium]
MKSDDDRAVVACRVCGKEVPRSAARSAEGRDYTYFFCSEGCRLRWSANQHADREPDKRH